MVVIQQFCIGWFSIYDRPHVVSVVMMKQPVIPMKTAAVNILKTVPNSAAVMLKLMNAVNAVDLASQMESVTAMVMLKTVLGSAVVMQLKITVVPVIMIPETTV